MKRLSGVLCLAIAGALITGSAWAQTYKWVDAQGRTHYTDTPPPPDARKATEKKMQANVVETSGGSYAERQAMQKAPVTLWLGNECDALCESALSLLQTRGIAYSEQRITTEAKKQAFVDRFKLKEARVPTISAGVDHLVGFSAEAWNRLLDRAGYPAKGSAKPPAIAKPATASEAAESTPEPPPETVPEATR